ncbi:MAG: macro domain-containing protein [Actinomycetota bacterium]|nr:macro domain-containing protein [Actinomycetota bacterium]
MQIETWRGDITSLDIDVIVNAANSQLLPGGGVCGAIHAAAGPGLAEECRDLAPVATGDAVATSGHRLAARWVVHAVGPIWGEVSDAESIELLRSAYRRSVEVADGLGAASIAFPAISTGIYGFPPELAARSAVDSLRACRPASVQRCVLVAFDGVTLGRLDDALAVQ